MPKPLTRKERMIRAYTHQEMDRPGVYCRTAFPTDDPTYDELKAYLQAHSDLKPHWSGFAVQEPYRTEHYTEQPSPETHRKVTTLHTPAGDLTSKVRYVMAGAEAMEEEPLIKSVEDAKTYLSLPMPKLGGDVAGHFALQQQTGDTGIVEVAMGLNPAGMTAANCGSENFAMFSATDRDVVHALCQREMDVAMARVKYLLSKGVGEFFSSLGQEYIVPPLHGPRDYEDFNLRYDKPIFDLIHEADGRVHVHCHGKVKSVFPLFLKTGIDVLHPFEPPPMGDITGSEAKAIAGSALTLEGNIEIADMYEQSPQYIRRLTEELIDDAFADRQGLILCASSSPYIPGKGQVCFPQFKAMIDTVLAWQG